LYFELRQAICFIVTSVEKTDIRKSSKRANNAKESDKVFSLLERGLLLKVGTWKLCFKMKSTSKKTIVKLQYENRYTGIQTRISIF